MENKGKIEVKKNKKRERIIEAASELFSRKNFHEVMMEDVAKLASIAKGTLYNYFNSKEDLYFSIMVIRMENLINSLREKIKKEINSIDSLHTFVIHNYMFMLKYSCFFMMFQRDRLTAVNSICDEFRSRKTELRDLLKGIVESGKQEKLFRNLDTEFTCDLILGNIYGAVSRAIDNKSTKEVVDKEREDLFDFILKGVGTASSEGMKSLPLEGRNIVITRSVEDSKDSASVFADKGACVINFPTLEIISPDDWKEFDEAVKSKFDILIFTSANAVRMFQKRIDETGQNINYKDIFVITVGKRTAALCKNYYIPVNFTPKEFSAEGLIKELANYEVKGKTVLIPSSAIAREELPAALQNMGAIVEAPVVYSVAIPSEESLKPGMQQLNALRPDTFIFTSPSTFRNFLQIMKITEPKKYFNGFKVAAIGPTTKAEIEKENVTVDIMPEEEYTMEGLLKAAIKFYAESNK